MERVSTRTVYAGRVVTLRIDEVRGGDGQTHAREVVEHAAGAAVVAVDEDGRVLLVRQHRPAVGESLLELPAGLVDPGEQPEACAGRELEEETGLRAGRLELLARFYSSPGFCTEELFVYLASDLSPGSVHLDAGEEIEMVREPVGRLADWILAGELRDAKTVVGVLAYLRKAAAG